jgi:predicted Zn-dependent protease
MRNKIIIALTCTVLMACYKVPVTERRQMNLLSESMLMDMSLDTYGKFLKDHAVVNKGHHANMVKNVGNKMAGAIEGYLKKKGHSKRIKNYKWEFNLVKDPQVNAWCMPGGKIVFYSGIMGVTRNETGVAVVMSHEIAHAIARHGNERMSQLLAIQAGGVALAVATHEKPAETRAMFLTAYGVGTAVGVALPFSRKHEAEADKMGLVFMALAGYDPREAIGFWERMAAQSKGAPPEFLSTHPSHETRIKKIKEFLPTAMKYYKPS